jgi:hypothetical protein
MREQLQQMLQLAKERNEKEMAWCRQVLTLASGGLALLVAMSPQVPEEGPARWFLAAAWVLLGAGILSGAAVTYTEVSLARRLAAGFQSRLLQDLREGRGVEGMQPIVANPSRVCLWCKPVMVLSLVGAVAAIVGFAVIRTLG